jgi:hypothetical protein
MTVALTTMVARLQALVPVRNGTPADYSQTVIGAVMQLSADAPIITSTTLAIVVGTDTYSLPADFLFQIALEPLYSLGDGVYQGNSGKLIASNALEMPEMVYWEGATLRIAPTPTYSADRTLRYAAQHVLVSNSYPRLTEHGARIALVYAQYLALVEQANALAPAAWKYSIGDESVDKSGQGRAMTEQANALLTSYRLAIAGLRSAGDRARYTTEGAALWG